MDYSIINADVLHGLRSLPDASVHLCVTSPPYYGLRSYGTEQWEGGSADCDHKPDVRPWAARERGALSGSLDYVAAQDDGINAFKDTCGKCGARRIDQQLGLEATPAEYLERMVAVFREVWRVLRPDGTCWVNMGDSYAGSGKGGQSEEKRSTNWQPEYANKGACYGMKPKDLMMMPARLALALQADGYYLRSDIIWCKRAPMPESVTDRPTSAHEHIFLLSKAERYFYDAEAVRTTNADPTRTNYKPGKEAYSEGNTHGPNDTRPRRNDGFQKYAEGAVCNGRNMWNYITHPWTAEDDAWLLSPEPYAAAHFATFPTEIPRRAILAGTSERGVCAECGAPWKRVTSERVTPFSDTRTPGEHTPVGNGKLSGSAMQRWLDEHPKQTTGWQPTCRHTDVPTVPATVLDPFSGAGTTLLVAQRLGRRSIGIDLSAEYCEMARRRIEADPQAMNMKMELVEDCG